MEDKNKSLTRDINPVFLTAKSCLNILSKIRDTDAQKLLNKLGFGDSQNAEEEKKYSKR